MTMTERTEKLPGPRRSLSGWPSTTTPTTPARRWSMATGSILEQAARGGHRRSWLTSPNDWSASNAPLPPRVPKMVKSLPDTQCQ